MNDRQCYEKATIGHFVWRQPFSKNIGSQFPGYIHSAQSYTKSHSREKKQGLSPNSTRRNFSLTRFLKVRFLAITIEKERTVCINEPNFIAVVYIFRITPCNNEFLNQPIIIITSIEFNVQVFALTGLHN